jgi:hypothetical protein
MTKISYGRYRFPLEIIQRAIWHYVRFTCSIWQRDRAEVMVARRAKVRVAARVGLERRQSMLARCGHCSTCASDQMLRRITPTAERTVKTCHALAIENRSKP